MRAPYIGYYIDDPGAGNVHYGIGGNGGDRAVNHKCPTDLQIMPTSRSLELSLVHTRVHIRKPERTIYICNNFLFSFLFFLTDTHHGQLYNMYI